MQNRFPPLCPPQPLGPRRRGIARPAAHSWPHSLPMGELLLIAAFGLVLLVA